MDQSFRGVGRQAEIVSDWPKKEKIVSFSIILLPCWEI
jgi:hypothetical protein